MKTFVSSLAVLLALTGPLTACSKPEAGSAGGTDAAGSGSSDIVTLKFLSNGPTFTNTEFKNQIQLPVQQKFPRIRIERIEPPAGTAIQELFSSGTIPDIVFASNYNPLKKLKAIEDLRPWIEKYHFDESRIKPHLYGYVKAAAEHGEIYAIPYNSNQHILYYNKDVFDKFGVPYPPDEQMTWEQTFELARKLTRTENGVDYIGLDVEGLTGFSKSLALPILDPQTGRSLLTSPEWLRVFNATKESFDIPGFLPKDKTKYLHGRDVFMKDRTMAMRPAWLANMVGPMEELHQQGIEVNWDIAPVPNFGDQLGKTREAQVHSVLMTQQSKHKDEAFQVIQYLLSDEVQRIIARNGRVPAIINKELEKEYGADVGVLKGKKIENIFKGQPLQDHTIHEFEGDVGKFVTEANLDLAKGIDVNTAIRKASEAIDKEVERLRKNQ
ncbi:ABC transporter substrate-binding protein [Paenibacillus piri]|uniref:Extracellular solute-binding protein n=1 Tax=Paenibacillus piri TaxID=2547395 RepID=A0A4R5KTN4_9BACL|nr:extracellular solute-binding protein [Paenibacillus piri]TDF98812.1 extracellular solute-binding protein [Paenibacillus piri]